MIRSSKINLLCFPFPPPWLKCMYFILFHFSDNNVWFDHTQRNWGLIQIYSQRSSLTEFWRLYILLEIESGSAACKTSTFPTFFLSPAFQTPFTGFKWEYPKVHWNVNMFIYIFLIANEFLPSKDTGWVIKIRGNIQIMSLLFWWFHMKSHGKHQLPELMKHTTTTKKERGPDCQENRYWDSIFYFTSFGNKHKKSEEVSMGHHLKGNTKISLDKWLEYLVGKAGSSGSWYWLYIGCD